MQQFRLLWSSQQTNLVEMTKVQSSGTVPGPPPITTKPPGLFTEVTTEQLTDISIQYPVVTAEQLRAISSALAITSSSGRAVVIPGSQKRKQATGEIAVSTRRMSSRLRHGIVLGTILFVVITTLISLAPLDNGQSTYHILGGIGDWFRTQQLNWQVQAHTLPVAQDSSPPEAAPPPMYLPKTQYAAIAQQDAVDAGISPDYFVRQINVESGFNPNAVSPSGAVGIAQFLPSTAAGLGINPWDPLQALRGAARLMASYAKNYGGDYAKALAAYNGGSGTVQYAVNNCGSNWLNCLPAETRHYIYTIMGI